MDSSKPKSSHFDGDGCDPHSMTWKEIFDHIDGAKKARERAL